VYPDLQIIVAADVKAATVPLQLNALLGHAWHVDAAVTVFTGVLAVALPKL